MYVRVAMGARLRLPCFLAHVERVISLAGLEERGKRARLAWHVLGVVFRFSLMQYLVVYADAPMVPGCVEKVEKRMRKRGGGW